MTTQAKIQVTSSELGTLWMTYQFKSAKIILYDLFANKTIDQEAKNILTSYTTDARKVKDQITTIFNNEKAVIPIGFDMKDIILDVPTLFDDIFHIMFLRQMMKLNIGHSAVYSAMSYMKEVHDVFKLNYEIADKYYVIATNYLLGKGLLAKPPYITMPKQAEFIEDKNYMSGFNIFSDKRPLNAIEVGYINEAIEDNVFGVQLMTGFAQVATDSEVKKYFVEGKELAKKIIMQLSSVLLQGDIQPSSICAGKATDATKSPFSDKLMMYLTNLISSSSLGYSALGTSFSMRSDLQTKLGFIAKDTFEYSKKGGKIMIKNKWMEEPPQMEDRNQH